ncbi:MAG: lasso peptide biosynthesis B2 protein [Actinomycetota bacterium]|nr:lasso peptide biosynthesis B2 protein [Actinomycetota bacterium]
MSRRYVTAPGHVAACDLGTDTATVIVNYRTGRTHTLVGPSARCWAELAATGDPAGVTVLSAELAARLVDSLSAAGLLTDTTTPRPWAAPVPGHPWRLSFGSEELKAGCEPLPAVPLGVQLGAALALAATLAVRHIGHHGGGMARILRLINRAHRRTRTPATAERARQAVHAVRRAALLAPGRVACLEESAAVVLMLALSRHRVTWSHGVAADPIRLHAWVETEGRQPVAEPPSTARYTPIRSIPFTEQGRP